MIRNAVLAFVFGVLSVGFTTDLHAAAPNPALAQKWVAYGQKLYAQRQYDQAIKAFSTAARANARDAAAWKGVANCLYAKRDYPNALKYYKYAYQLNPADTALAGFIPKLEAATAQKAQATYTDYGFKLYSAKRYDQAIQYFNAGLQKNPNDARAWQGLGYCYYAKQDKPNAVNAFKKAIQLNPQNTALANFLAKYSPEDAEASGIKVAYGPKDWVQPLWRSALLPGWGQFYNDQPVKGWLLGATNLLLIGGTIGTYVMANGAYDQYSGLGATASQSDFDNTYASYESMKQINHICYYGYSLAYAFTLVDAVVSAKRKPISNAYFEEKEPAIQMGMVSQSATGVKMRLLEF